MKKYKFIKDCTFGKAGEVKEVGDSMAPVLTNCGYIEPFEEDEKPAPKPKKTKE